MVEWTRKERKEYIKKKYFERRVKIFVFGVFITLLLTLIYEVIYFISKGNIMVAGISFLSLLITIPLAIFWIDIFFREGD